ncbi:acyl-ACP--UDP-N- acetylglucosamine O-acyltransferase [Intrasporangium sp. YIM S08009]|uniref:acyl-ACP--UDP-N- acetylglucosamine O-acyltransferase n=1 Tax=Intrasporangium zincisolvens TaxID=3080018 RepID=UPI002B054929|nr:acyl-ACP--UDP-N- acetylglucosamine O-acyltransferase [Intrasporangium sp. YIM S08009]
MSTDASTRVSTSAFVGPGVELGVGVSVGPFAVLVGPTRIGDHVRIGPGAHVGGAPEIASVRQNDAWDGDLDHHEVSIGSHTVLRDHVVVHHGSVRPTTIGAGCLIFSRVYVAHDVHVGDGVTLSAGVSLGGHVTVRARANLGLNVSVHQRRVVGGLAMVGMGTPIVRDVPPFATVFGVPARVQGCNRFGMERAGMADKEIEAVAEFLATGSPPAPAALSDPVREELTWWHGLAERVEMERAT